MPIGSVPNDDPDAPNIRMNPFAVIVIMLTFLAFMFIMFSISYTFGHVIPTLCMIESPAAKAYMPVQARDGDAPPPYTGDDENETNDAELLLVQNQPLTSSIRATLKHLREKGGFWSRFRGLSVFLVWTFTRSLITNIVASPFTMSPGTYPYAFAFAAVVAETMLARLHLTWVHIVISDPSPKPWYKRVPPWRTWKRIAPSVFLLAVCTQLTFTLPLLLTGTFGSFKRLRSDPNYEPGTGDLYISGSQAFFAYLVFLFLFVACTIPALVTMVRVAASMLPEEDETIVEFDRSFQGRTTPEILGGQGKIGIKEAWKSFPRASRVRLLKLMAKVAGISVLAWAAFVVVMVVETRVLLGDSVGQFMRAIHGGGR